MGNQKFINKCKQLVVKYANKHLNKANNFTIILPNNKALLSATLPSGVSYELTDNGDKKINLDAYKKFGNIKLVVE